MPETARRYRLGTEVGIWSLRWELLGNDPEVGARSLTSRDRDTQRPHPAEADKRAVSGAPFLTPRAVISGIDIPHGGNPLT
jgi:hypothetical protein